MLHAWRGLPEALALTLLITTFVVSIPTVTYADNASLPPMSYRSAAVDRESLTGLVKSTLILRNGTMVSGNYAPTNGHQPDIPARRNNVKPKKRSRKR